MVAASYARLTRFALWALTAIVVTGAAVRLTGSGLGCEDWPTCSEDRFVADLEYHAMIEFLNRLFTGVVALAVIGAVLGSLRRRPRRTDLTLLSFGLVVGVLAQVGLGALLVRTELDPRFTMGHFLVSMVLLWNAAVLDLRARHSACEASAAATAEPIDGTTRLLLWLVLAVTGGLLVTGTLVTGAGPHAGDTRAERLPLLVAEVARIHGIVALVLLGIVLWTCRRLRNTPSLSRARMARAAVLLVAQGAVGYTQYFTGVPVLLVGVHVTLASLIWIDITKAAHAPATEVRSRTAPTAPDSPVAPATVTAPST